MVWYHGTPDVRALRDEGRFTPRTEPRRVITDPEGLRKARGHAAELGISDSEAARRLDALAAFHEMTQIPVPVFLSARRDTAATYANDQRAMDYQNAEPAVLSVEMDGDADVVINAAGETFRGLSWDRIEKGLVLAGRDADAVKSVLRDRLGRDPDGRIRVADLGAALWLTGCRVVDVRNVIDTHTGKGRADTVRMVFDLEMIVIPAFERGPEP